MRSLFVKGALALAASGLACSAPADAPPVGTGGSSGSSGSSGSAGISGGGGVGNTSGGAGSSGFAGIGNVGNTTGSGGGSGKMGCGSNLTATIRDLKQEHPDVEVRCKNPSKQNNWLDTGMVAPELGADGTPTYVGPVGGTPTTTGPDNFYSWYHDVADAASPLGNQKISYTIEFVRDPATMLTVFDARTLPAQGFYPIDGQLWGNPRQCIGGLPTGAQYVHNYYFTTELHTVFVARQGDVFSFSGDDDVWVFINGRLVVDLGGIHETLTQDVMISSLGLTEGMEYSLDFFHAERQAQNSNFKISTNLFFTVCGVVE